jgi:DHA1 family solute carrier family 18 vesicular amine transporter 1/2
VHFRVRHILTRVRRLLVLVSSIVFVDAMLFTAITPLVPGYVEQFDLTKTQAGLLVGAFGAGAVLGGIPGGIATARFGPKRAVVLGLVLLAVASLAFASAGSALALGAARFVQGVSSTATWAGALGWIALASPRGKRGAAIGVVFGIAVLGAVLGPVFGGIADIAGIRGSFAAVGGVALAFAAIAGLSPAPAAEGTGLGGLGRALRDTTFLGGLWLNALPAILFGTLAVLAPLALDEAGWSALAIAAAYFCSGIVEAVINPFLGRATDQVGHLRPVRAALVGSIVVACLLAVASQPFAIALLITLAAVTYGSLYTPSMALSSHRAEVAGLAQGIAFGIMNTAWALGQLTGPALGGALADSLGDPAPYLLGAGLCAATLAATWPVAARRARPHAA